MTPLKKKPAQKSQQPGLGLNLTGSFARLDGSVLENLRLMIARIYKSGHFPKRLALVSALPGEGVTSVSLGMGAALANDYKVSVCLVELNWYSPAHLNPDQTERAGISDLLAGHSTLEAALIETGIEGFSILPAGRLETHQRPVVARSKRLLNLLKTLEQQFDHLILDIPPLLITSDAVHMAGFSHACCVVVRQGRTTKADVMQVLDEISQLPVLGIIVNQVAYSTPDFLLKMLA